MPDALTCALALRDVFEDVMRGALKDFPGVKLPTLSVGVGVGHSSEIKDRFGVSWQVVPTALPALLGGGDAGGP